MYAGGLLVLTNGATSKLVEPLASTQSWRELLLELSPVEVAPCHICDAPWVLASQRGLWQDLASAAGAMVTLNVLNAMPKSIQPKAKAHMKDI
jgi:hypothetical protein